MVASPVRAFNEVNVPDTNFVNLKAFEEILMVTFLLIWLLVSLVIGVIVGHCIHAMGQEDEAAPDGLGMVRRRSWRATKDVSPHCN